MPKIDPASLHGVDRHAKKGKYTRPTSKAPTRYTIAKVKSREGCIRSLSRLKDADVQITGKYIPLAQGGTVNGT